MPQCPCDMYSQRQTSPISKHLRDFTLDGARRALHDAVVFPGAGGDFVFLLRQAEQDERRDTERVGFFGFLYGFVHRKIEHAGHGAHFFADAFSGADEQWIDESFRSEPRLAHHGAQSRGAAQAAKAGCREGHAQILAGPASSAGVLGRDSRFLATPDRWRDPLHIGMTELSRLRGSLGPTEPESGAENQEPRTKSRRLILRHLRINPVRPGQNPSRQVVDFLESSLAQEIYGLRAADAAAAVGHDFFAGVQLVHAVGEIAERNQVSADVADLVFVGLAHVENVEVVAAVEALFQIFHLHFGCGHFGLGLLAANSAELLIVNQLGDGRILSASRAIGILAQLEFAELHAERVDQQQAVR